MEFTIAHFQVVFTYFILRKIVLFILFYFWQKFLSRFGIVFFWKILWHCQKGLKKCLFLLEQFMEFDEDNSGDIGNLIFLRFFVNLRLRCMKLDIKEVNHVQQVRTYSRVWGQKRFFWKRVKQDRKRWKLHKNLH